MKKLGSFATRHPIWFSLSVTFIWLILLIIISAFAYSEILSTSTVMVLGRLILAILALYILIRLRWLKSSGVTRAGNWLTWLIALVGTIYLIAGNLYAFFGLLYPRYLITSDLTGLGQVLITSLAVALAEELLFRGIVLNSLVIAWGKSRRGLIAGVSVSALLFSIIHLTQVFTESLPISAALLLILQTFLISFWWGALVISGKSLWPAVMAHFAGNAAVAVQALFISPLVPSGVAYQRLLLISLLLGVLGILLLLRLDIRFKPSRESLI